MIVRKAPAAVALVLALLTGCATSSAQQGGRQTLRLGYFPNITHATAIVGTSSGIFARALGDGVRLEMSIFNAGPEAVQALFSDALDAAYIGPNPAINAFSRSKGAAIRIVSGATSGGAFLIVKPSIRSAADLKGKKIASPQRGNTQDVALRSWLATQGFSTSLSGAGDVSVLPQENAQSLETFKAGTIDGAWVPEPWASRLVLEGGGVVLVDERSLWPGGRYATTLLVVRTAFLEQHRDLVRGLLRGQVEANDFVNRHPAEARQIVAGAIATVTGKRLPDAVVDRAWSSLSFTNDPIAASLESSAAEAVNLGLLDPVSLKGVQDLSVLNEILRKAGRPEIAA
jgi:NitT/TauT family transport system substrate-binding protein